MFFVISKLLFFLTQPINWILALLIATLFFKHPQHKKRLLRSGIILLLFFTNHLILNTVINWWEPETLTAEQITEPYDIAILLGGFSNFNIHPNDRYNFNERGNRLTQTLELYFSGKVKKILISGGTGATLNIEPAEASAIRPLLIQFGVNEEDIIIENQSRNTFENALYTKEILTDSYPTAKCLLITSAFHIHRASACFKKQNINFTAYAVDYMQEKTVMTADFLIIPNSWALMRWGLIIKEWIGYGAYWARGYL